MSDHHEDKENDINFRDIFVPLTARKAILFIIIIGLIVYANSLFNGFVWDDVSYILLSTDIHPFNIVHLFGINEFNSGGYFRPIPAVYFALLYNFFGSQVFFYHFFQISLHILDACLVFIFLKKFFRKEISFFLSLLFLIHPMQVESVVYIGASQSELLFLFGLSALLVSIKDNLTWKNMIVMSGLLLLSLLTKETSFLFLLVILFFQVYFKRRKISSFLPYIVVTLICYFFIRLKIAGVFFEKNISSPIGKLPLLERLQNIPELIFYYIKTFFYPAKLGIDQRWIMPSLDFQYFYVPLLIDSLFFLLIGFLGFYIYKVNKKSFSIFLFFLLWFIAGIAMLLQIFPLDMTVADRWFYFPSVGLLGMIGVASTFLKFTNKSIRMTAYIMIGILFTFLSIRTVVRNANWIDAVRLYSHDIRVDDNYDLEDNLGAQLAIANRYEEALPHLIKGVREFPHTTNLYDLGNVYEKLDDFQKAEYYYKVTLSQKDVDTGQGQITKNTYEALARVLVLHGKPDTAKIFLEKALKKFPSNGSYWAYLAISEYKLHNQAKALAAAKNAKILLPNSSTNKLYNIILNKKPLDLREE